MQDNSLPVLVWDMEQMAWQDQANCKGLPVDMFYYTVEDTTRSIRRRKEKLALKICSRCDVKSECLQDAIDRDDAHSIQGGTTPRDRGYRVYVPELDLLDSPVTVVSKDFETGKKGKRYVQSETPSRT
jgi:WhiB family redox-sensing transcriptional regulator